MQAVSYTHLDVYKRQGLYPVEQASGQFGLVRLQVADQVPLQSTPGKSQDLVLGLLDICLLYTSRCV